MNTSFKKVMAGVTAVTIVAMNGASFMANAANAAINSSTAANVTTALTITNAGAFPDGDEINFASLKRLDGSAATTTVAGYVGNNADGNTSVITLSADPTVGDNNQILLISFTTVSGDFGTAQLTVGTPTANTVTVSATVLPTLTLALANATVALGTLSVAAPVNSATDPTATVVTNAVGGFTLSVDSANNGLTSTTASHTIGAGALGAGTQGYALAVSETADPQTNGSVTAAPVITGGAVSIASSTGPTGGYVATVDVGASISAITPNASDYTDTLTFTVTGSF